MTEWQAFISKQHLGLRNQNHLCDAGGLGLILVTGDDAGSFLQNQLSNDIELIDENHFQLSSYSTPKGRMLGIFRVVAIANGYILITSRILVLPLLQRLQMFVVQAQVSLADASDHFSRFAIQSDISEVNSHPALPVVKGEVYQSDSLIVLNLGKLEEQTRYLVLCLSFDEAQSLWQEFAKHLEPGSFDSWRLAEIKSAMPIIYAQTSEEFVAQMANLNPLDGINFKKGCYPGQEIVARMQYLGKLKRRMFLAQLDTRRCPAPGDELVSAGKSQADGSGKVVDSIIDEQGNCLCLFIAQIKKAEDDNLQLLDQPEVKISLRTLPYSIDGQ